MKTVRQRSKEEETRTKIKSRVVKSGGTVRVVEAMLDSAERVVVGLVDGWWGVSVTSPPG